MVRLSEFTLIWPPPERLGAEYHYEARHAKSLGLSQPPVSRNVKGGNNVENDEKKESADTDSLSSKDVMSVHILHF